MEQLTSWDCGIPIALFASSTSQPVSFLVGDLICEAGVVVETPWKTTSVCLSLTFRLYLKC